VQGAGGRGYSISDVEGSDPADPTPNINPSLDHHLQFTFAVASVFRCHYLVQPDLAPRFSSMIDFLSP
jgi:hypothetical protein